MARLRDLDRVRKFDLILVLVAVEPNPDHRVQAILPGDCRYQLVALAARKCANPFHVRLNERQPFPNLRIADLRPGALALDIGAEADAVNFRVEYLPDQRPKVVDRQAGDIESGQRHFSLVEI